MQPFSIHTQKTTQAKARNKKKKQTIKRSTRYLLCLCFGLNMPLYVAMVWWYSACMRDQNHCSLNPTPHKFGCAVGIMYSMQYDRLLLVFSIAFLDMRLTVVGYMFIIRNPVSCRLQYRFALSRIHMILKQWQYRFSSYTQWMIDVIVSVSVLLSYSVFRSISHWR